MEPALDAFRLSCRLSPNAPAGFLGRARLALRLGLREEGEAAIDEALRLEQSPDGWHLRKILQRMDGLDYEAAERLLIATSETVDLDRAERNAMLETLVLENPNALLVTQELAEVYLRAGELGRAIDLLLDGDKPRITALAPLAGLVLCHSGRIGDALTLVQKHVQWDALDVNLFERLAMAVVEVAPGAIPDLLAGLGDLHLAAPRSAQQLIQNVGISLFKRGAWGPLAALGRRGVELFPTNYIFAYSLLHALLELGELDAAVQANDAYVQARFGRDDVHDFEAFAREWSLTRHGMFGRARALRETRIKPFFEREGIHEIDYLKLSFAVSNGEVALPGGSDYEGFERRLGELTRRYGKATASLPRYPLVHTLCVRDEVDLVEANLAYHFRAGVDCAIVTDNSSVDGTRQKLEELARRWPILIIDEPKTDYNQPRWVTRMAYLARDVLKADWVILGDADEFWHTVDDDLPSAIRRCASGPFFNPSQIFVRSELMVPELSAAMSSDYKFYEATTALRDPLVDVDYHWLTMRSHLKCWLSQAPKTWVRAADVRLVAPGNHHALMSDGRYGYFDDLSCLHFHTRSFEHFRRKIRRNFEALETGDEKHRQVAHALLTLYRELEQDDGYEVAFRRQTTEAGFIPYARQIGRAEEITSVRDFILSGMKIDASRAALPAAIQSVARRYLDDVETSLPRFIV